jgi:Fe-S cluster assembly protein SufD
MGLSPTSYLVDFSDIGLDSLIEFYNEPAWVSERRREAWQAFRQMDWPSQKDEEWMRTDIRLFKLDKFQLTPASEAALPPSQLTHNVELAGQQISVDGFHRQGNLSAELAARGVLFGPAHQLLQEHEELLRPHFMSAAFQPDYDRFAALHAAFWSSGTVLYVPRGVTIRQPLHILNALSPGQADLSHLLVILGDGAEATLLTETASTDLTAPGFHCGATEIVVGKQAHLRFVSLQDWGKGVYHFGHKKAIVGRDSSLQWTVAGLGSRLTKVNQHVELVGEGASSQVNGVLFAEDKQHLSYHTLQHHRAAHCRSDFLYKAALQDHARTVWRGMIKVDPQAQKTDGYQRNDNLLLSATARADSIPGLEIEADDVRCTHGSTSGRVDEELIFYAQARGYTRREAIQMIVTGFFQQVFDRITIESVRDALGLAIARRVREYE